MPLQSNFRFKFSIGSFRRAILRNFFTREVLFAFILGALVFIGWLLRYLIPIQGGYLSNIIVEFHGLIFDVALFGVVLSAYEKLTKNRNEINRALEELDDYRDWRSEEAGFRVRGIIRRLGRLKGSHQINLSKCYFHKIKFDVLCNSETHNEVKISEGVISLRTRKNFNQNELLNFGKDCKRM